MLKIEKYRGISTRKSYNSGAVELYVLKQKRMKGSISSTPERLIGEGAEGLDQDLLTVA